MYRVFCLVTKTNGEVGTEAFLVDNCWSRGDACAAAAAAAKKRNETLLLVNGVQPL